jgi:lysophospholipase L1-like esterase
VLLVGTNDAKKDCTENSLDAVAEHFKHILTHFEDAGVPLVVMTPPPVEKAKRLTGFYSAEAMTSLSQRIATMAYGRVAGIVDLQKALADGDGTARAGMTMDGIHLSAQGYRLMHGMLETTIAAVTAGRGHDRRIEED